MSQENVQLVMRCFDLFNRGEMEALLRYVDPAIETTEGVELPGATRYVGHAGLAMAYRDARATRNRANAAQVVANWIQLIVK